MIVVTCKAPVNIAVIKYCKYKIEVQESVSYIGGKRDEELILPLNDSLSGTLSTDYMCAKTTIMASPVLKENKFWLNGKEQSFDNQRLDSCLKEVKRRANSSLPHLGWNISICSENNFPTAAGLASSAAGYACLVVALAELYGIEGDISTIARRGSGSACRSVYGGWVQWCKGKNITGEDSIAKQIASATHWPEMRVLILVVNDEKKKYSSTSGMKSSVETSKLLKHRADEIVPKRIDAISDAILKKNFDRFARITMEDSNQFHAICLDTFPPCVYMNDTSHAISDLVHAYNEFRGSNKVAYTFDAGPNACLYLLNSEVEEFLSVINHAFPPLDTVEYYKGMHVSPKRISEELKHYLNIKPTVGGLKYIIHTKIGDGPKILRNAEHHLLNEAGFPKTL